MDAKTRDMIRGWVQKDGGDVERTARWASRSIKLVGIREWRALIAKAMKEE